MQRLLKLARPTENHHAAGLTNKKKTVGTLPPAAAFVSAAGEVSVIGSNQSCLLGKMSHGLPQCTGETRATWR